MPAPILYTANRNYSTWSLRAWLVLRWAGIAFEEHKVALGGPTYGQGKIAEALAVSPTGRLPALHVDGVVIHDSLAICEWANERAPQAQLWPADALMRAQARSVSAEMHSGFTAIRRDLSMNIRRRVTPAPPLAEDVQSDLDRLFSLWANLLGRFEGPFLFGQRSIADAMFTPVATRLRTYAIPSPLEAQAYCATLFADSAFQDWEREAIAETWTISQTDDLYR